MISILYYVSKLLLFFYFLACFFISSLFLIITFGRQAVDRHVTKLVQNLIIKNGQNYAKLILHKQLCTKIELEWLIL